VTAADAVAIGCALGHSREDGWDIRTSSPEDRAHDTTEYLAAREVASGRGPVVNGSVLEDRPVRGNGCSSDSLGGEPDVVVHADWHRAAIC
jgi:hypothetical protein